MLTRAALFCLALLLASCRPPVPRSIAEEIEKTPPGQTTVVFFTDFQCPFCRRTHAALEPLVAEREGRVRVVLKHVPLRRHPDARTAARAAICVEALAKDPAPFHRALAHADDLSEEACATLAVQHGVVRDQYERCVRDPATEARIERDVAAFDAVDGDGVPLLFIGRTRLEGAQRRSALEAALDSEK